MSEGKGTVLVTGYQSKAWPAAIKQLLASGYSVRAAVNPSNLETAKALNQTPNLEFVSDASYTETLKDTDYVVLTPGEIFLITYPGFFSLLLMTTMRILSLFVGGWWMLSEGYLSSIKDMSDR